MPGRPRRRQRAAEGRSTEATPVDPGAPTPVHDAAERRAQGYVWETFRPGNYVGLRHGAFSPKVIEAVAGERAEQLMTERPDLAAYPHAVSSWARAEALAAILWLYLDQVQPVTAEDGGLEARDSLVRRWQSADNLAARRREELGLGPVSHARLLRERADATRQVVDLEALRARGRAALEARSSGGAP